MDNYFDPGDNPAESVGGAPLTRPSETASWGPDRRLRTVSALCILAAAAWAVFDRNSEDRLVAAVVAVAFLAITLALVRIRLRLVATDDGLTVRGIGGARHIPWAAIHKVSTPRRGRFGRRGASLELEVAREVPADAGDVTDRDAADALDGGRDGSSGPGGGRDGSSGPGEGDDELLVFGAFDLGVDPAVVGREIARLRRG